MNKLLTKKRIFYITLLLLTLAMAFVLNIPDYDIWARLIVGKHFLETFSIFKHDFLSYTPTHFWYDHEWGASVIFYAAFKLFGSAGLTVLKGLLSFGIVFFISKTVGLRCQKQNINPYNILFYVIVIFAMNAVNSATVRCHMFSFLFFSAWIYLLERVRLGEKKWLFYFPLIMIFWSNIHGGCVSGLGLLLLYAFGEFLNKKPVKDYLISMILSVGAMFINPYGINYVIFLLKATTMPRPMISEWLGTFNKIYFAKYLKFKIYFVLMVLVPLAKVLKNGFDWDKLDKTKLFVLIATSYIAVVHIKMQPFFVIAAACFLYEDIFSFWNARKNPKIAKFVEKAVYFVVVFSSMFILTTVPEQIQISKFRYPIFAVEFIKENNIKGNLFVNFEYGSYAAYKLYPNNLIVMDGRYEEVYDNELLDAMKKFHLVKTTDWDYIIKKYPTDIIIIEKKYPVYKKLLNEQNWKKVFEDVDFAVFVPTSKALKHYKYPPYKLDFYDKSAFETNINFKKL